MKYFVNFPYTAETLKAEFRTFAKKLHPDTGGNADEFKAMQAEFEEIARNLDGTKQHADAERARQEAEARRRQREEEERERREEEARQAKEREEEKARREEEKRRERERIEKAQEETRAAVRAWASILERIPATVSGKKRAYDFTDKKACAAYIAATKRNIKAVINHYFPGLDVKVTISGEIWKEVFSIAWEDGPTADELRKTCKELEYFVPSFYASDPYADYGSYYSREESEPWRDAYGGGLGDATDYDTARTLSEEGENQAANTAAGIFADFDPAKLYKNNEQFKITFSEWHKFAELCNLSGVYSHFENLLRDWTGKSEGMAYYSSIRRYLRDHVKVSVNKKEKAPEFKPTYGPTLKAIKKALGGNVFAIMQETKRRENDWTPCDFSALLGDLQGVKLCKPYSYDMETYYSPVYFTSYKTESNRREKFEAVGITLNGASVKAVREDVAAKIREELEDIERQREQWELDQLTKQADKREKASKPTNSKQDTRKTDSGNESEREGVDMTAAPAEGLRLIETAAGVAVVADDWKTTYFNKKYIKAHGAHWNKERKQWEATEPQDVDALRAWFFFHGKPTDQGATIDDVTTDEEQGDTLESGQDITDTTTNDIDEGEPEALRGATLQEIERKSDRTAAPAWLKPGATFKRTTTDGREVVAICTRLLLDGFAYITANGCAVVDHVAAFAGYNFDGLTPCDIDDNAPEFAHMLRNFQRIRKGFEEYQTAHPYTEQGDTTANTSESEPEADTLEGSREISALFGAVADFFATLGRIAQEAARFEGVTIPAETLTLWRYETEEGTKQTAEIFAEVCACLASLTPAAREKFDGLGVIFWTLSEQVRNGAAADTIATAVEFARAQLFDMIERTQTPRQAAAVRAALHPEEYPDFFRKVA